MAGWMDKAKDYIKGNPGQAGSAIDKVEDLIDQRTGGKYADKVDQGGDVLRDKLGLPGDGGTATLPPQTTPEPAPAPTPEPLPTPEPAPAPEPAPTPAPTPAPEPAPSPEPAPAPSGPTSSGDRDSGASEPVEGSVPNLEPGTNDPQQTGSITEGSIVPGDNERVGQPGGPMDPQHPAPGQPVEPAADHPSWGAPGETTPEVDGGHDDGPARQ